MAVLIRGRINLRDEVKHTLDMLKLFRSNYCIIIPNNAVNKGMLTKVKDYVTFGELDPETEKVLQEKRAEKGIDHKGKEITKPFFRLHPPRGGFERKGIKKSFTVGGALGYRGAKINKLIQKMI